MKDSKLKDVTTEGLRKLLVNEEKSYEEVGNFYNVSSGTVEKVARRRGIKVLEERKVLKSIAFLNIKKVCEFCGKEHNGSYGSGRFCCSKCARKFSSNLDKEKRLSNISKSLKGRVSSLKGKKFNGGENKIHKQTEETKKKISNTLKNNKNRKNIEILKNYLKK